MKNYEIRSEGGGFNTLKPDKYNMGVLEIELLAGSILSIVREDQVLVPLDTIATFVSENYDPIDDDEGCACGSLLYRWVAELEGEGVKA